MQTETTTETVAEFVGSQVVVPRWMRDEIDKVGPAGRVTVTRISGPFGRFVKEVEAVGATR